MTRTEGRAEARRREKAAKRAQRAGLLRGGRAWVTAGALAAYSVCATGRPALAATVVDPAQVGGPVATLPLKKFEIAAGPLDAALAAFEQTSGLHVRVDLPAGTVAGFQTKGVKGLYRSEEALWLVLEGTGLQSAMQAGASANDPLTVVVGLRRQDTVNVTAEVPDSVTMTKFTEPLLDTPQTVVAVPQFVLHDEQNTTLRDALRNVPGISMAAGEFGAQGDKSRPRCVRF